MQPKTVVIDRVWNIILYGALGIITILHLLVFTKYTFDPYPNTNNFTTTGEMLKTYLPLGLLITLIPFVRSLLDRVLLKSMINIGGLAFATLCLVSQVANTPGQAWSTVAFSTLLILALNNYLIANYNLGNTVSIVLSFMTVWVSWTAFEVVYQVGLWLYHPSTFGNIFQAFLMTLRTVIMWMIPPLVYIVFILAGQKIRVGITAHLLILSAIGLVAVFLWFYSGMLVPTLLGPDGRIYGITIKYFTIEHLEFSISRLCQISMMGASALLFIGRRANAKHN